MPKPDPAAVPHCLQCQKPLDGEACENDGCLLVGIHQRERNDRQDAQWFRRQKIVDMAVDVVSGMINMYSDRSQEERDYFEAEVAKAFLFRMNNRVNHALNKKDMQL